MKRKHAALAWTCIGAIASGAQASITHSLDLSNPPGLPAGVLAWDLHVTVSPGDDWSATALSASAFQGSFVDTNPLNVYNGSNDADTWFAATDAPPNGGGTTTFPQVPIILPTSMTAAWIGVLPNGGGGTFTHARILATSDALFTVSGQSTTVQSGGNLTPFTFTVPSPGTLALLALVGCIGVRRRRWSTTAR